MNRCKLTCALCVLALTQAAAAGIQPRGQLMARRAAELDAYRLLAERVLGLQLTSETTVRDFVLESDEIATRVSGFLRGVRTTDTREFADGSVEVDVELPLVSVVETLTRIRTACYRGGRFSKTDFTEITRHHKETMIKATGTGAPRASGPADPLNTLKPAAPAPAALPPIWKDFAPQQRLMARRAALLDGYRRLAEQVWGLRIDSETTVRDFVTQSDEIRTQVEAFLRGAREVETRYTEDGIVEVDVAITLESIVTTLRRIHSEKSSWGRFEKLDFEQIQRNATRKIVTATGMGAPAAAATQPDTAVTIESEIVIIER
ncbi:hypothetical protein RAS2_21730 [Phycisphaerae bacterium RAS2]|nr:hypothetical protein RAS2_21730 [Phycisphaerae bacterium RAS2]